MWAVSGRGCRQVTLSTEWEIHSGRKEPADRTDHRAAPVEARDGPRVACGVSKMF